MLPELFRIPGFDIPVFGYGLMLVIGFLVSIQFIKFLARRSGFDPDLFVNASLIGLVVGIIGARLSHVLENIGDYTDPGRSFWANLIDAINIRNGGLTFYGGLLLAAIACISYGVWKKIPLRPAMDVVAPALMLALGFGRFGCFLNGCCYGAQCDLPWAVQFPYHSSAYIDHAQQGLITPPPELLDERDRLLSPTQISRSPSLESIAHNEHSRAVHPAQLYSVFNAFLISALLFAYFTMPHAAGRVFALMLLLKGMTRFLLELLRVEPPVAWIGGYGLSISMVLSIGLFITGAALWFVFGRLSRSSTGIIAAAPAAALASS